MRPIGRVIAIRTAAGALALVTCLAFTAILVAPANALQQLSTRASAFLRAAATSGGPFVDLDDAAEAAGNAPRLILPELSSKFAGPSGTVAYLPGHVTPREGGRVSLFELAQGTSATIGLYVAAGAVYERKVTRKSGTGRLAVGHRIEEQLIDVHGQSAQTLSYEVTAIDAASGSASFSNVKSGLENGDIVNDNEGWCWSCAGGSSWWCGFPCFPKSGGGGGGGTTIPTTAALCAM